MNIITFQAVSKNGLLLSVDRQHKYNEASEINKNIDGLHGAHARWLANVHPGAESATHTRTPLSAG